MHPLSFLHNIIKNSCPFIHAKRLSALLEVSSSLLNYGKLSLSSLGRHLQGESKVKNKIKKIDRLLGNGQLYRERLDCYKAMAVMAIAPRTDITVLVDWSPCVREDNQILRASLALKGRSITLYEEVHPLKSLGKYKTHKAFLKQLKKIIPADINVLVVTDAGFRTQWFQLVLSEGWQFEGRVRTQMKYSLNQGKTWKDCKSLYQTASNKAKHIGKVLLTKANALSCEMYLYKESPSKKKKYKRKHNSGKMVEVYRKTYQDPWLLVTSVSNQAKKASWVIKQYKLRMKIEHEFRDTKDAKWGLGLRYTKTVCPQRLQILLLIGAIALFTLWLIGLYAESKQLQFDYQANTIRSHRVLSLTFLGLQIMLHQREMITEKILHSLLDDLETIGVPA